MKKYTGVKFSGEAVLSYQFLTSHFNISPSALYNDLSNPDTWIWPIVDKHFAKLNNNSPIHEPSGEKVLLNRQQAALYITKDTATIHRMVKDRRLEPVIVTAKGEKRYRREDLEKLQDKPFCYNIADITGLDTPCQNNKPCKFKDCTWHGFFEII